jgi:hypothetical protein
MSVCRKLPDGTIQKIAGHTILLDANASEVRTGTVTATVASDNAYTGVATFSDPMPDADYTVILNVRGWNNDGNIFGTPWRILDKTATGFTVTGWRADDSSTTQITYEYTAFKPVKIEGYTALQNKVENPDDTPTIDSMNLVTSDGVARAIENASAVWKGTKAEWAALPAADKLKYDLAVLTDTQLIKSVDRTDGSDSNVADLTGKIFRGTEAEWNALSAAEKDEYDQAETRDVEDPVVVFDPSVAAPVEPVSIVKQGNYINGSMFGAVRVGHVITVKIEGRTGSNIPYTEFVVVAKVPKPATISAEIMELVCCADQIAVSSDPDSLLVQPYARAWVDTEGNVVVYLSPIKVGATTAPYTGAIFIGGTYISSE